MNLNLKDHYALITGGANGIGLATAELFAQEGANLVLWDYSPNILEVSKSLIEKYHIQVFSSSVDITDFAQVQSAAQQLSDNNILLNHVVHCAAIGSGKFGFPFTNLTPADWPKILDVNIMGMVNIAHALTPPMIQSRQGSFVFLASVAGQIGSQTDPPYSASKAANINFAQCMAKDLATHNIRVNTVNPGMVQTNLNRSVWQAWHDQTPAAEQLSYEEWAGRKIKSIVPLGRWQTPQDIANMIVFLSSERANQITGQTINVDGGFVMHW